ncbi:transcriptional regulator [Alistipes sp. An54]|uniref:LacI family DNA-binding transcriptional regulator n=1 Tax=Alistipes sp. An54 TaxID=1965645 RepID=UPI000B36EFC2|nr:LacI family DNA-binding transcriptional regulator [Alistipes sp. An54]OUN78954.1 transcriptional regulator [Alistipes sp. An54]
MQKETLITIAERTGFSISTVSRVLNGKAQKYRIGAKTVEIITEEARKCNYQPNVTAQSLRTRRTNTIGLVVPNIDNPFFANIANVIIHEARLYHYTVILIDSMENERDEREGIDSLMSRNIDGIIVVPCGGDSRMLEQAAQRTPIVLIDRYFSDTTLPYVSTDNYLGSYNATRMLLEMGHRRICCIQGPPSSITTIERVRGYREALQSYGLEDQARVSGTDFTIQNGYVEAKLAFARAEPPTAIFALSNTILLGTIKAAAESGLRIPDDLSVISFDNYTYLDFLSPAITRVNQPIEEMGILAVKMLFQILRKQDPGRAQILLPPSLIVRDSVRSLHEP